MFFSVAFKYLLEQYQIYAELIYSYFIISLFMVYKMFTFKIFRALRLFNLLKTTVLMLTIEIFLFSLSFENKQLN